MTHQFKFGDRVRDEQGNEFIVIRKEGAYCEVINEHGKKSDFKGYQLTLAHTDDAERLDFIERAIPISGCLKREMKIGWQLQNEDNDPSAPKLLLRDAIDTAMQEQAAESEEQS